MLQQLSLNSDISQKAIEKVWPTLSCPPKEILKTFASCSTRYLFYEEDSPQQLSDKVRPAFQSALLLNLEYCVQTIRFTNQSYLYCTRKEFIKSLDLVKKLLTKNLFRPAKARRLEVK
jgi:hypothetical protein